MSGLNKKHIKHYMLGHMEVDHYHDGGDED